MNSKLKVRVVPLLTKLIFKYEDRYGNVSKRWGMVIEIRSTLNGKLIVLKDETRNGNFRQFYLNRMSSIIPYGG